MKKIFLLLVLAFVLTACGTGNPQNPADRRYFEGYKGVEVEMANRDAPPPRLYYYSDTDDNTFDITAEVWNRGSSFARGGLYLSGYDPNLIHVDGINPSRTGFGTCGFSIGNIGFGNFGFGVECNNLGVSVGQGGVSFSSRDLGENLGEILGKTGWDKIPLLGTADVNAVFQEGNTQIDGKTSFGLGNGLEGNINFEYGSRGKLLIALFAGVDFTRNFGVEYLLAGDTPEFPGGDVALVDWDANIEDFPPGLDQTDQTFLITNCYLYSTHAAPVVCIDPAPFSEGEKSCVPSRYNPTNGQGAPVAVTSVEQENTPRQAIFTINIANQGSGNVWDPGMIEKCSPYHRSRVTLGDKNKVYLGQIRVSGDPAPLDCVPDRFVRLDRDTERGFVTCKYDIPFQGLRSAYQTPLVIELWYGYEDTVRRTVTIKRAI